MAEKEFAKGVSVKEVTTKYGSILKIGINVEKFYENPQTETGYINLDILKGKESGKPYAVINNYKHDKKEEPAQQEPEPVPVVEFAEEEIIIDEEIPF